MATPKKSKLDSNLQVLVTRPAQQAANFMAMLEGGGVKGISFPAVDIAQSKLDDNEVKMLNELADFNIAIFVSTNAVNYAMLALKEHQLEFPDNLLVAAVGPATAEALKAANISVDIVPDTEFNSEGLLAMPEMAGLMDEKIIIFRGQQGRELLGRKLTKDGAEVNFISCYTRVKPDIDPSEVIAQIREKKINAIAVTSVTSVDNLFIMLDEVKNELLSIPFVVASNRIADECDQYNCSHIYVAENSGDKAMYRSLIEALGAST